MLTMNYKKHYKNLITRAKNRNLRGYKEKHHIIPKCLHGNNNKNNIIELTAREHFISHLLLVKIYPGHVGLVKAAMMMCTSSKNQLERINNRRYEWLRKKHSKAQSICQSGRGNSQYGTICIKNNKLRKNKRINKTDIISDGWEKGSVYYWDNYIKKKKMKIISKHRKIYKRFYNANKLYKKFKNGNYKTLKEFCVDIQKSKPYISRIWHNYVNEYKMIVKPRKPISSEMIRNYKNNSLTNKNKSVIMNNKKCDVV